jgi:hypothetical protein
VTVDWSLRVNWNSCTVAGRAEVSAGEGVRLPRGGPGVLPPGKNDISDARVCILERTQRRTGVVDEEKLLRLNSLMVIEIIEDGILHYMLHPQSWRGNSPCLSPTVSASHARQGVVPLQSGG